MYSSNQQTKSLTQVFLDENKNYLTQYEVDEEKIVSSNEKLNEFKLELSQVKSIIIVLNLK